MPCCNAACCMVTANCEAPRKLRARSRSLATPADPCTVNCTVSGRSAAAIFASYALDNVLIDAYDVVDNKPKTAAYRAPGAPIVTFAAESLIDEMAETLKMDPIEFRLLNVATEGTRRADGV